MMFSTSKRTSSRPKPIESIENDGKNTRDSLPLPPLRSPLISIQDPFQTSLTPRSAPATPAKSFSRTHAGNLSSGASNGGHSHQGVAPRDRGNLCRTPRGMIDAKAIMPVHVPHFELSEDPSFWNDHNVQILIRVRPMNSAELGSQGNTRCLVQESSQTVAWTGHPDTRFTFDHVACETISQEKLFRVAGLPMVENCMSGYNSCMFAYGQTGSGKTYTMMGDFHEMDNMLSEDCGMTPRIFEYLFMRIKQEEEARNDEQLKYSCKCSFLEIYNEQITDLLEPSSTNLQLREDMKKGVYVENLKECEVSSVKDVLELLLKGAANRKIAATCMNSESSRSHCVFTCIIESRWEKDSLLHLRYGQLNLVDLAGSERQKSSGAEGERLKEAANINRSLSTLGLVIMTLVDVANGKNRHVPYRDSKLTFLLQDSLGGNSKTTIIATVSPSICSAGETLSTLKFAQRAKLIQNNAKVNEDASGDVMALQQQIEKLKDQVVFLIKHQNIQRFPGPLSTSLEQVNLHDCHDDHGSSQNGNPDALKDPSLLNEKIEFLEAALIGSLRREKMVEATVRRLEAEIEHMNRLIHQREDDTQHIKAMLRFREEKIKRLEMLADDLLSSDGYLMEENISLSEENKLLRERIDRNPELTQFALENKRLLEQLRVFQEFNQEGERDMLVTEVSHLRNQLYNVLEGKLAQDDEIVKELERSQEQFHDCLEKNVMLTREVDYLRNQLALNMELGESSLERSKIGKLSCGELFHQGQEPEQTPMGEKGLPGKSQAILSFQDELDTLMLEVDVKNTNENDELHKKLCYLLQENIRLSDLVAAKDAEISAVSEEWERAIIDLTSLLVDGYQSLEDAHDHIGSVMESFPQRHAWINGRVERAIKALIEKERLISDLQKKLEDAQKMGLEMRSKLDSLRGATLAITEVQQLENDAHYKELIHMKMLLNEKMPSLHELENSSTCMGEHIRKENSSNTVFSEMKNYLHTHAGIDEFSSDELANGSPQFKETDHVGGRDLAGHLSEITPMDVEDRTEETEISKADFSVESEHNSGRCLGNSKENACESIQADLLFRFEEVQGIMEEAEFMLNALLKANEDSKQETNMWRRASEQLLAEQNTLVEEVQRLEASISSQDKQAGLLVDQIHASLKEVVVSSTSLEESIQEIQRITREKLELVHTEILSVRLQILQCISSSRSWMEEMLSEIMKRDFELFVISTCHIRAFLQQSMILNTKQTVHNQPEQTLSRREDSSTSVNVSEAVSKDHAGSVSTVECDDNILLKEASQDVFSSKEVKYFLSERSAEAANNVVRNTSMNEELARKHDLVEGLLFDIRLLQESATNVKDMKDKTDKIALSLQEIRDKLVIKTAQVDDLLVQQQGLEVRLIESETTLSSTRSELERSQETLATLSYENSRLRMLLEDAYFQKSQTDELLKDEKKVIEGLEKEILSINASIEAKDLSSVEEVMDELRVLSNERDHLRAEIVALNDKLEMASALADENEAIAVEARQAAEASKIYAEEKEEEVKVLERSIDELESTVEILEKKVNELQEEAESHKLVRRDSELKVQALSQRMLTVEGIAGSLMAEDFQLSRHSDGEIAELFEARKCIEELETEIAYKEEENKQYRDHISELLLHSEAQSSLYQEKFKALEDMISEFKADPPPSKTTASVTSRGEKTPLRTRRSGSPFRCISNLVQQMNCENDQELSIAKTRIQELESLAANRQKEICMLSARLAAVDSMTHDVIRDLLGVKLDMTNFADLINEEQLENLVEKAQQRAGETEDKENEILNLKDQIDDLLLERNSWLEEVNQRKVEMLTCQVKVERLQQRDQLLTAQNEMLKLDKKNLHRKIAQLDETVKKLAGPQSIIRDRIQEPINTRRASGFMRVDSDELRRRSATPCRSNVRPQFDQH
ncbi:Plus-end-directed kinesin ATPase protein [Dioscorea alata]|uniref:Plus-end-directed kinesin ATPase protein n=1 Tax=Dioscorea alata TaxID=55571 RepID=A0ACB7VPG4_DIOAL|nr:Plus-end-directed kinesin ATPase protein [Dioscorea alata]